MNTDANANAITSATTAANARAFDAENAATVADDGDVTAAALSQKTPQKRQKTGIWPSIGS